MKYSILFFLALILLIGCTQQSPTERFIASNPSAYELGQTVYNQQCAECHGIDGEGQFPNAPLQPDSTGRIGAPPHDGNGHTWHHADDLLYQIIREGGMGDPARFYPMPAFGEQLSDEEISAVVFYIKTFWSEEQRQQQAQITARSS